MTRQKVGRPKRLAVYRRANCCCQSCGKPFDVPVGYDGHTNLWDENYRNSVGELVLCSLEIDHIVPVYLGGTHTLDNMQALCTQCNRAKGHRLITEDE